MKLRDFFAKHHLLLFYSAWLVINLVQAGATELFDDEAYYWIYSQYPAWGYFDHPPMIAWLIRAGYSVFPNEFGVRLLVVVLNTATLYLIQSLTAKKNDLLFYCIAASIAVAQIGGIIAVPDLPLLFFVAVFFVIYKRFVANLSIANSILLALSIALMLYSKYHGILIVFFTLLSNPKLFTRYQTYLVTFLALALFAPHIYWQYTHGFPSVQFHLFERNAVSYRFSFTLEYIFGQLALAGPLVGWLFLWGAFRYKPTDLTERAMKFSVVGIYTVFFISTLKGRAEANWTVPAFVGLIVLSHQYFSSKENSVRWIKRAAIATLIIVFAGRIYMLLDIPASPKISKDEFHENVTANEILNGKAGSLPVVVIDSYQKPSKYMFYRKAKAFALNTANYRRNNFNYWPIEDSLIGRSVYALGPQYGVFKDTIGATPYRFNLGTRIDNYFSFSKIRISKIKEEFIGNDKIQFTAVAETPSSYLLLLNKSPYDSSHVQIVIYNKRGDISHYLPTSVTVKTLVEEFQPITVSALHNLPKGKYSAKMAITSCIPGFPSLNSTGFKFEVK